MVSHKDIYLSIILEETRGGVTLVFKMFHVKNIRGRYEGYTSLKIKYIDNDVIHILCLKFETFAEVGC